MQFYPGAMIMRSDKNKLQLLGDNSMEINFAKKVNYILLNKQ